MIRKVIFPIKLKLIGIITLLLLGALSFYILFAVDLFNKDKSAYVYENGLITSENLANNLSNFLNHSIQTINLMAKTFNQDKNPETLSNIFLSNINMSEFSIFDSESGKKQLYLVNKKLLASRGLPDDHFGEVEKVFPISISKLAQQKETIENTTIPGGIDHFMISFYHSDKKKVYIARILLDDILKTFQNNKIYNSFAISSLTGIPFIKQNANNRISIASKVIREIISGDIDNGAKEVESETGEKDLISFSRLPNFNLFVISEISKKRAFKAAAYLINKSLYFGAMVIAISIIIGIFFSKQLTSHINKLFQRTQRIAEGDFSGQVTIHSRDEIGALSDSFNYMSQEIIRYMEEMKEKARVENELAVAKLVQDSFFPEKDLILDNISFSAFHAPATECGGDWWSYIKNGEKTIFFIADATGHGVPAALLTATVNCCANNLKELATVDTKLLDSPANILSLMNSAVCSIGEKIMLTCFVGIVDPCNKKMTFANASHNPPLLYHPDGQPASKQSFHPIMGAIGPRLGHKRDAVFLEESIAINPADTVILYTDGIIECTNVDGKAWGERNFLKSLAANITLSPKNACENILLDARTFYNKNSFDDDITLVMAKVGNA